MTQDLGVQARILIMSYPDHVQKQHFDAWARVEAHVTSLVPKGAKVFEVQHSINHVRILYFKEVLKRLPSDLCERNVLKAYNC